MLKQEARAGWRFNEKSSRSRGRSFRASEKGVGGTAPEEGTHSALVVTVNKVVTESLQSAAIVLRRPWTLVYSAAAACEALVKQAGRIEHDEDGV